jgi:hypothetical protein
VIAVGRPEDVADVEDSWTGRFLEHVLPEHAKALPARPTRRKALKTAAA